ncbi:ankyrin repeat and zinc finger domain-containing protein 1-like isoform X2 [Cimex lectularius]|uniref:VLRF1 domain-containing protein n=1 Tax=Cimex lectularius TaxID=79782 RepID=A0A8I6REH0_CIMLE|nr:ankyrin repeat and zinc finger domain-containing protein 1-like isoform X2 [Cimex lectularius]
MSKTKPAVAKTCMIYNTNEFTSLLKDVKVCPYMNCQESPLPQTTLPEVKRELPIEDLSISDTLFCSYCNTGFLNKEQQRAHYKQDWHRYNLKQHLNNKKAVSEERFSQLVEDDLSSISGSESSDNEEGETDAKILEREAERRLSHLIARRSRVLFNNNEGQVISVHRCVLLGKKEKETTDDYLVQVISKLPFRTNWLIVMLGGGHFAAAIFKGGEAIQHKTFHCYTVRAKQGGTQSSKDNKSSHSKSAGASLRRYNEQSMTQHVQELVKNWGPEINKCDLIFYRAVGRGNSGVLFSGTHPLCVKSDPRLRKIPFTTNRATFNEVKRVHEMLSSAFIYESNEMFKTTFSSPKAVRECSEEKSDTNVSTTKKIDRGKERPSPVRELPDIVQHLAAISTSGSEGDLNFIVEENEEVVSFLDLKEFDDTVPQHIKDRMNKKPKKKKKEQEKDTLKPELAKFWKKIHSACQMGDTSTLKSTLDERDKNELTDEEVSFVLNQTNISGETILHNMAAEGNQGSVRLLMLHGADPCLKDKKSLTPYDHSIDKNMRNIFRRFMVSYSECVDR